MYYLFFKLIYICMFIFLFSLITELNIFLRSFMVVSLKIYWFLWVSQSKRTYMIPSGILHHHTQSFGTFLKGSTQSYFSLPPHANTNSKGQFQELHNLQPTRCLMHATNITTVLRQKVNWKSHEDVSGPSRKECAERTIGKYCVWFPKVIHKSLSVIC